MHEFVGKFKPSETADGPDSPYHTVKDRLMKLNYQFASRCGHVLYSLFGTGYCSRRSDVSVRRDSDIFQARIELSDTIKAKSKELETKDAEIKAILEKNAALEGELVRVRLALADQEASTAAIVSELENVRALIDAAEARTRQLENENQDLYARFLTEKQKMAAELNEMNNVVDGMKGFVGGGVSFLKSLKSSILPSAPIRGQPESADMDEEFEILGEVAMDRISISGALSGSADGVPAGMVARAAAADEVVEVAALAPTVIRSYGPPRVPAWTEKCHATEINDACVDGLHLVTAGSDSVVKVYSLSRREMLHSFMSTGPSLSVDLVEEEWVMSACAAGRSECRIWSLKTGRQRVNFGGHANKIMCARFIGNLNLIVQNF